MNCFTLYIQSDAAFYWIFLKKVQKIFYFGKARLFRAFYRRFVKPFRDGASESLPDFDDFQRFI